jgi:hypothetical protein
MNHASTPVADLHTPQELLDTAVELVKSDNPKLLRGAILEALASLEAFIQMTVFPALTSEFSADFSEWLAEKTKMDFDSRLLVLAPLVSGVPVSKNSALWSRYKETRDLRKKVVHGNMKVTRKDAMRVIENTAEWMAYLGSTLELEKALLDLKAWAESRPGVVVRSFQEAEALVADFFMRSKAASATLNKVYEVDGRRFEADAILKFGDREVLVEAKFVGASGSVQGALRSATYQLDRLRAASKIRHGCVVVFTTSPEGAPYSRVTKFDNGATFAVVINTRPYEPVSDQRKLRRESAL